MTKDSAIKYDAVGAVTAGEPPRGNLSRLLFVKARPGMQALWAVTVLATLVYMLLLPRQDINPSMLVVMMASFALVFFCNQYFPFDERHPYAFFGLMCTYLVLISTIVYFTGGRSSLLGFLFLIVPVYGAHYYSYTGTMMVALATTAARFIPFMTGDISSIESLTLALSATAYVVLGFIACYIVESERIYGGRSTEFKKLLEISRSRDSEVSVLCNLSRTLPRDLDLESVYSQTVMLASTMLPCDGSLLYTIASGLESLSAATGFFELDDFDSRRLPDDTDWVSGLRHGRSVTVQKTPLLWLPGHPAGERKSQVGSIAAVPLLAGNEITGYLVCYSTRTGSFHRLHSDALSTLASQAAIAIDNARLYSRTLNDMSRFETVLRAIRDGLLLVDPDGKLVEANPVAMKVLGIGESDLGRTAVELLDERLTSGDPQGLPAGEALRAALDGEAVFAEYAVTGDAGGTFQLCCVPLAACNGSSSGLAVFMHDITDLKKLDEMKTNFVSNVSHELRAPLTSITGFVGILLADETPGALTPVQREHLKVIQESSFNLATMIDDLLELSRLIASGDELDGCEVDIAGVIDISASQFSLAAAEKEIHLCIDIAGEVPCVKGDAGRLGHVVTNILGNAIKYTDRGGKVTVSAGQDGGVVVVSISDTGCGITPSELPHLFDRFFRARKGMSKDTRGFGLGLAISRDIVNIHGGKIWVESEPGSGSTFCFTLPVYCNSPG